MTRDRVDGPWGYGTVTEYERYVSIPAARAGLSETDFIVRRAFDAAYNEAAEANNSSEAEAA